MDETNSKVQWNPVYKVTNGPKTFSLLTRIFCQRNVWQFLPGGQKKVAVKTR